MCTFVYVKYYCCISNSVFHMNDQTHHADLGRIEITMASETLR